MKCFQEFPTASFQEMNTTHRYIPGFHCSEVPYSRNSMQGDIRRVRCEQTEWYRANEGNDTVAGLGGGNLMIALTQFALLSFIAKVYRFLTKPEKFHSMGEHMKGVDGLAAAKIALPENAGLTLLSSVRPGECNEEAAFWVLVKALNKASIPLGIVNESEAKAVWTGFRNMLTHMANLKPGLTVETYTKKGLTLDDIARDRPAAFRQREDETWICNADRLTQDIAAVASWVCDRVEECDNHERLLPLAYWVVMHQSFPRHWSAENST